MKCIISIDVGVQNLAICILCKNDGKNNENTSVSVPFWKWYNVLEKKANFPNEKVEEVAKTKGKKSKRTSEEKRTDKKAKEQKVASEGICENIIRKTGKPCGLKGTKNSRGRAYCGRHDPQKKHSPDDTQQWVHGMVTSLPGIGEDIKKALNSKNIVVSDLQVLIEQQSLSNKKILLMSHLLYGFFVSFFDNSVPVRFVPAYNKLSVYDGPEIECNLKTPYAKRKFMAKKHTIYFLDKIPGFGTQWRAFFDKCKSKQDDVSDCFLQGLYYITSNGKGFKDKNDNVGGGINKSRFKKARF